MLFNNFFEFFFDISWNIWMLAYYIATPYPHIFYIKLITLLNGPSTTSVLYLHIAYWIWVVFNQTTEEIMEPGNKSLENLDYSYK